MENKVDITSKDIAYMQLALQQAEIAYKLGETPIGCVIVWQDQIIGKGYNRRVADQSVLAHAEMIAIAEAEKILKDWRLEQCTLYVTLEPCPMCAGAIVQARIPKVVYATDNLKAGSAGTIINTLQVKKFNHQVEIVKNVLEKECTQLLQKFFEELRKEKNKPYSPKEVEPSFYQYSAKELAPKLVGKLLCRRLSTGDILRYRITETECYYGEKDSACHAHKGKTSRTEIMYQEGGIAYVFLCYGIHYMFNIVTGKAGFPEAVLIRGVEGYNGPGKLTKAMKITKDHNGMKLISSNEIWVEEDGTKVKIERNKRIGIGYASEKDQNRKWRFTLVKS